MTVELSALNFKVTLIHGDCLKIAPTLNGVDCVIGDPPYGMDWNPDTSRFSGGKEPGKRGGGKFNREKNQER